VREGGLGGQRTLDNPVEREAGTRRGDGMRDERSFAHLLVWRHDQPLQY
jgi:hypothetical protein